ncbi:glyoxalase/bleomycin resistance/extradiol dioxygenase family protein [Lysinibacillus yapensis]|uniref:Glyoxalase/bleomycin resistance/extradiol dioxygenase family protein n=1 Tax=Ureibacillus yapensis TaxID=2304605 RepID=A0A396SAR8_9BACL|nr:VOC family protein [Lysinibacillus yapensis]RHW38448.1 glyoxalase/bleomycin resistance/extradiol dioxygenase family protein [Lysinibacillus yapensis]
MIPVYRLGYASFQTKDVEAMIEYYTNVLGCVLVDRADDGTAYISNGLEHHNIILKASNHSYLDAIGWQVNRLNSLQQIRSFLKEKGIASEILHDAQPGIAEQIQFTDPDGNLVQLYHEINYSAPGFGNHGIVPNKLGHIALSAKNAKTTVDFYREILGFKETDWIWDVANFLTCNEDHHTLNIVQGKKSYMHHIAFELRSAAHQFKSSDILAMHEIPTLWGPQRHTAGHNIASYHFDPDQHVIEFYTDMDKYIPELNIMEPKPWHKDLPQRPKKWDSLDYWGTEYAFALPSIEEWKEDRPIANLI